MSSPTTDKISFSNVHANIDYGHQVTATKGTALLVEPVVGRDANPSSLPSISVPANGATTTEDVSITL